MTWLTDKNTHLSKSLPDIKLTRELLDELSALITKEGLRQCYTLAEAETFFNTSNAIDRAANIIQDEA